MSSPAQLGELESVQGTSPRKAGGRTPNRSHRWRRRHQLSGFGDKRAINCACSSRNSAFWSASLIIPISFLQPQRAPHIGNPVSELWDLGGLHSLDVCRATRSLLHGWTYSLDPPSEEAEQWLRGSWIWKDKQWLTNHQVQRFVRVRQGSLCLRSTSKYWYCRAVFHLNKMLSGLELCSGEAFTLGKKM